ncbi:zinc-binding dehydrogenase [Herbiconiux moechotypicola]|uniref:Zinc-dependent dehydrogenase n=1 Tax=Herbiconiux moechotypicola TaxID=637393 RepID=A0ABN3DD16_9MICO|nr:zinc-binding dehydrogenase [Herbiconiux moechotypicola]MCS5729141.1 zinc-binding dehydrogenase [Herbiconiux moechotypicola]
MTGILLRTEISSICGSDLHGLRAGHEAGSNLEELGHESVGVVVKSDDPGFTPGQRVLHAPVVEDGRTFAPFQRARPGFLVAVPEGLDAERAVFGQQLGTVLWSLTHYLPTGAVPTTAFIAGAGPAGLLFLQVLRGLGAELVVVSEPVEWRRELAARFGAVTTTPEEADGLVASLTDGRGVALAVDASGAAVARAQCVQLAAQEGVVGFFGIPNDDEMRFDLDLSAAFGKNLTLSTVQGAQFEPGLTSFSRALEMIADGSIDVDSLISHRLTLDQVGYAFDIAARIADGAVKVLVDVRDA